jgi:hypothetical protein
VGDGPAGFPASGRGSDRFGEGWLLPGVVAAGAGEGDDDAGAVVGAVHAAIRAASPSPARSVTAVRIVSRA